MDILRLRAAAPGTAWRLLRLFPSPRRVMILCPDDETARALADDLNALSRRNGDAAPAAVHFAEEEMDVKTAALSQWTAGAARFLTASPDAARTPLASRDPFRAAHRRLRLGDRGPRDPFVHHLAAHGYDRVHAVEKPGEFAVRGEVLDLWAPGWDGPLRALWPFDQIEALRKIDLTTQRSGDQVNEIWVPPATISPAVLTPAAPATELMDYAVEGTSVVELGAEGDDANLRPPPPLGTPEVAGKQLAAFLMGWLSTGGTADIFCHNAGEEERLEDILLAEARDLGPPLEDGRLAFVRGDLHHGFVDPEAKRAVFSNGEIFGRARRRWRLPKFSGGEALEGVGELRAGDYVVHENFGIGRYTGLSRVEAGGVVADYLRLEYKGGDRVMVPLFEFKRVQKYVGAEGKRPRLSSLDTAAWDRAKQNVEKAVAEMAAELLERAARRAATPGYAFPADTLMETEFAGEFLYDLTPDQARAIEEVKADMAAPRPMDRLVCGDVGYGKTEVALRAAMKAVSAGKQVLFLAPTTILAEQHARNLKERLADFPVRAAGLTRFTPAAEERAVVDGLRAGTVDIAVGTHRLLSPDIIPKDLGLVVVDEEHRFGVKQKERIQSFRDAVDVLALSATPIPRTLGAALGGLKALSVIETPPEGRLPIATHVGPLDEKVILAAVENELRRGGQVFYVHNRIGTLDARKAWIERTLGEHGLRPRIAAVHGKMTGPELEKTMWDFMEKKFEMLLATSIIESGLDIPSVNTLIVEEAEDFGLAQLYQLRGRVGRERQKAYCFLFHSPGITLTEEAQKRLDALKEFASLGSGFKLALRDLEIRGAGNLLGPQQHGFVNAVGVDLYGRLLADEIAKQKGGGAPRESAGEVAFELPVSAFLPEEYLPAEGERIAFYKRLLDAPPAALPSLKEELVDRCGALPAPAETLFRVAGLRHLARRCKVVHVALHDEGLDLRLAPQAAAGPDLAGRLIAEYGDRLSFIPGPPDGIRLAGPFPEGPLAATEAILSCLDE